MLQEQLMLDEAKKLDLCEKMRTAEVNRVNRLQKILQKVTLWLISKSRQINKR